MLPFSLLLLALMVQGEAYLDAPLTPGAIALAEPGRYQSTVSFDDTITFYKRAFRRAGGVRWRSIINLPGIKAMHLQSTKLDSPWEGINIYEKQGQVRLFVIKRDILPETPKAKRRRRKRRR